MGQALIIIGVGIIVDQPTDGPTTVRLADRLLYMGSLVFILGLLCFRVGPRRDIVVHSRVHVEEGPAHAA